MAKKPTPKKTLPFERLRGGNLHVERWTNAKAALVAFRTGQGWTSVAIANELNDGTSAETIRHLWKIWKLPYDGRKVLFQIPMTDQTRGLLLKRSIKVKLEPQDWAAKVLQYAIKDDMYNAIVEE